MWTRMQCSYKTGLALSKRCNCDHTCNKFAPPFCNSRKPVTEGEVNEADHLTQNKTIRFSFSFRDKNGLVSFIVTGWRWHELQESSPPGRSQCGGSACPVCVPALTRAHSRNVPPQYDLKEMKCHTWGMLGTLVLRRRGLPQATSGVWPSAPARPFQGKTREGMCRGRVVLHCTDMQSIPVTSTHRLYPIYCQVEPSDTSPFISLHSASMIESFGL